MWYGGPRGSEVGRKTYRIHSQIDYESTGNMFYLLNRNEPPFCNSFPVHSVRASAKYLQYCDAFSFDYYRNYSESFWQWIISSWQHTSCIPWQWGIDCSRILVTEGSTRPNLSRRITWHTVFRLLKPLLGIKHRDQQLKMGDFDSYSCTNIPTEFETRNKRKNEENVAGSTKKIWRCKCVEGDVSAKKTELSKI